MEREEVRIRWVKSLEKILYLEFGDTRYKDEHTKMRESVKVWTCERISSATQSLASRRGVYDRVLGDVRRTHSICRDEDSLSDKDIQYRYVDRAYFDSLLGELVI